MKLLLHTCCAPCLIYPLERFKAGHFSVTGFFYNPNIHPYAEYRQRKSAVSEIAAAQGIEAIFPEYLPVEFFRAVNLREASPERCLACWRLRLKITADTAKGKGYDLFSTTLLVSPYQDQERLKEIGEEAALEAGVKFYYEDFRPGFRRAHDEAHERGIYCQKYCGCIYSEIERKDKKLKRRE